MGTYDEWVSLSSGSTELLLSHCPGNTRQRHFIPRDVRVTLSNRWNCSQNCMETTCIERWLLRIEMDNNSIILESQNMENCMKRGPEESHGSARKSTMEKLQLLVKEMQVVNKLQTLHKFINMISYKVEEREFAQGMEGRIRRAEELKKMIAEKEERLRKAKDEVVPIYPFQHSSYSP